MLHLLNVIAHTPTFRGALSGAVAAAVVDIHAFLTWKSFDQFRTYDWGTAGLRWFQGAFSGAVSGAGYGMLVS